MEARANQAGDGAQERQDGRVKWRPWRPVLVWKHICLGPLHESDARGEKQWAQVMESENLEKWGCEGERKWTRKEHLARTEEADGAATVQEEGRACGASTGDAGPRQGYRRRVWEGKRGGGHPWWVATVQHGGWQMLTNPESEAPASQ